MHTIILNSDDAANTYLTSMLEMIKSDLKFNTVLDTAESLADLGADVKNLLSTVPSVAFTAFREQFSSGNTMMFVSDEDSKNLETWNDRNENFQIAVFRHDGQPVGVYGKAYLNW